LWLDLLSLAAFAGLTLDQVHLLLQALSATAAVLVASACCRAAGRLAAAFAAVSFVGWTFTVENHQALYNTSILPFLGAVFLVIASRAAERPRIATVVLTALVAALMASAHAACALAGVSAVWIALLAPRNRLALATIAALVFAAAALAIGPASWISNAQHMLRIVHGGGMPRSSTDGSGAALVRYGSLLAIVVVAAALARRRPPAGGRLVDVAVAIEAPMLVALIAAGAGSTISANDKYMAHIAASGAVCLAAVLTPVSLWAAALLARWIRWPARLSERVGVAVPFAAAAFVALSHGPRSRDASRHITFDEAAAIPRELSARGWTYARAYRALKSPESATILASFELQGPSLPMGPATDDPTNVYVFKVAAAALEQPLPDGWVIADQSDSMAELMVFARSALSYDHYEACGPKAEQGNACIRSGLALEDHSKPDCVYCVPGMPLPNEPGEHVLELRIPVRQASGGKLSEVVLPRRGDLCAGRIASVPGGSATVSADRRRATWAVPEVERSDAQVRLEWHLGSADCGAGAYSGLPPFFLEGDAETVGSLERALASTGVF
jgi:hypothetical protein